MMYFRRPLIFYVPVTSFKNMVGYSQHSRKYNDRKRFPKRSHNHKFLLYNPWTIQINQDITKFMICQLTSNKFIDDTKFCNIYKIGAS